MKLPLWHWHLESHCTVTEMLTQFSRSGLNYPLGEPLAVGECWQEAARRRVLFCPVLLPFWRPGIRKTALPQVQLTFSLHLASSAVLICPGSQDLLFPSDSPSACSYKGLSGPWPLPAQSAPVTTAKPLGLTQQPSTWELLHRPGKQAWIQTALMLPQTFNRGRRGPILLPVKLGGTSTEMRWCSTGPHCAHTTWWQIQLGNSGNWTNKS